MLLPVIALLVAVAGCSSDEATTATGPAETSSATAAPATSAPKAGPATAKPTSSTGPSSSTTTKPVVVTTAKPAPTTAKPAPTTAKPKQPTTTAFKVVPTTRVIVGPAPPPEFCAWAKAILSPEVLTSFKQFLDFFYVQTQAVRPFVPGAVGQDYNLVVTAFDKLKPAIDSGEVKSQLEATQWFSRNDPALFDQVTGSVQAIGRYRRDHCA